MKYRISSEDSNPPAQPADEPLGLDPRVLQRLQNRLGVRLTAGNRMRLLRDGAEAYPAMLEAIAGAKERILFETYILRHDHTGVQFFDALLTKLREGVEVYCLYDAFGSLEAYDLFDELAGRGAHCLPVNPAYVLRFLKRWRNRDHRKILVVDGDAGFMGGINIGDEYIEKGASLPFRDTHVEFRGPVVRQLESAFLDLWADQSGMDAPPPTLRSARKEGASRALAVCERFRVPRPALKSLFLTVFGRAQKRLWLTNSYFVPDRRLRREILRAALRGVDVRLILPSISDVPWVRWASRAIYPKLLNAGVRVFEYQPRVLHAKTLVMDERWALVGSTNLDHVSFQHNIESQALVLDTRAAQDLAAMFEQDLAESKEITWKDWAAWPLLAKLWYRFFHLFADVF